MKHVLTATPQISEHTFAHICFSLDLNLIFMFLRLCTYELGIIHANQTTKCLRSQNRTKGESWSTANKLKAPSNFIAGRPKAALLFWFFGDFICGGWLCFVILVRYKIENRKNSCSMLG